MTERRVLQRVVFPDDDLDVLPLYVETNPERGAGELASEQLQQGKGKSKAKATPAAAPAAAAAAVGETQSIVRFGAALPPLPAGQAMPRRTAVVSKGRRVSFGTYFNAFPASYWRRWSILGSVTLRLRLTGEAMIVIYRSSAKGHSQPIEMISVDAEEVATVERSLSLRPFIDGGWYWFDIVAGQRGATLIEAEWAAPAEPAPAERTRPGRISIGITTFNRPEFLLENLRTLGEAPEVLELLDAIYVVDQGTSKVREHQDYADATKKIADKLRLIEQGNLGGSGGFSRAMSETLRAGLSDYVLLLDDDIKLEPEGIIRAATFADLARRPTIVGGHMFSLNERSVLHAFAETVSTPRFWWGAAPNTRTEHDFGRRNLRNTPWLHRRAESDYNGWWMCLIPTKIIAQLGLALPVFIKWDDSEYGLRAKEAGYPTVSLPGVAVWHIPWLDKTDALDWQAYYHIRNRLVAALLHSPHERGGQLPAESLERQLQHLLSMQYSTARLRLLAVEDVLSGPDHLHRDLPVKMKELRELRLRYTDAQTADDLERFPVAERQSPDNITAATTPTSKVTLARKVMAGTARQLKPVRKGARTRPQMALPHQDVAWFVLARMDSALVSEADNTSVAWYRRDPKLFRSLMLRSVSAHRRLGRKWPQLAERYRTAMPDFTSPQRWQETFDASVTDHPGRS